MSSSVREKERAVRGAVETTRTSKTTTSSRAPAPARTRPKPATSTTSKSSSSKTSSSSRGPPSSSKASPSVKAASSSKAPSSVKAAVSSSSKTSTASSSKTKSSSSSKPSSTSKTEPPSSNKPQPLSKVSSSKTPSSSKTSLSKTPSKSSSSSRDPTSKTSTSSSRRTPAEASAPSDKGKSSGLGKTSKDERASRTVSRRDDKVGRSGKAVANGEPRSGRGEKGSSSQGRKERPAEERRRDGRQEKASSRSERGQRTSEKVSSMSKEEGSKRSSSNKSSRGSTREEKEKRRDRPEREEKEKKRDRPEREEKEKRRDKPEREEKEKRRDKPEREENKKEERTRVKSSRSREKTNKYSTQNGDTEGQDSGVEGVGVAPAVIISQSSQGQEVEGVDQAQNSLETLESGISLTSPRELSADENDVEESISSKMVEVDESEEEEMDRRRVMGEDSLTTQSPLQQDATVSLANQEEDNDYEDDFESYESDFEEDSGSGPKEEEEEEASTSDEEESEDSDLSEVEEPPDPEVAAVLLALKQENNFESRLERAYSLDLPEPPAPRSITPVTASVPETIPEHPEGQKQVELPQQPVVRPKTSRSFVNFEKAKRKQSTSQNSAMSVRGRKLLSMIQLDIVNMDLLTLAPVSYEAYISSFGQGNRQQVQVQTNEDALSEEVQTEEITTRNKWTQKPVYISVGGEVLPGPEDYLGVGGDQDQPQDPSLMAKVTNTRHLTAFLSSAAQIMLATLEEELLWNLAEQSSTATEKELMEGLGFSHPPAPLGASVKPLLQGRPTPHVQFCHSEPTILLSCHGYKESKGAEEMELHGDGTHNGEAAGEGPVGDEGVKAGDEGLEGEELGEGGLVCVWSVQEPSRPQQLLACRAPPMAATFSPGRPSLVLAGLSDGTLVAWDLREPLHLHGLTTSISGVPWRVRAPSFLTACGEEPSEESRIVSVQAISSLQDQEVDQQGAFQVVTLTSDGRVTWWVVARVPLTNAVVDVGPSKKGGRKGVAGELNKVGVSPQLGAAPWARIALSRAATISVAAALYGDSLVTGGISSYSLKMDPIEPSQLYVATGTGSVAHCSRHNSKIYPKAYLPDIEPGCEAQCVAVCPHDPHYLLVGGGDGMVRLHSRHTERPLTSWQSAPDSSAITDLQWLHVWDLSAGDIFPLLTVEAGGLVASTLSSFHIAPSQLSSSHPLYAVFASDIGELVLRKVSPEFCTYENTEDYDTELERFTCYVNII